MTFAANLIERLTASWDGWRRGYPLSPEQRAAWVKQAWSGPARYTLTQPGRRVQAMNTWRRAVRVHRRERGATDASLSQA